MHCGRRGGSKDLFTLVRSLDAHLVGRGVVEVAVSPAEDALCVLSSAGEMLSCSLALVAEREEKDLEALLGRGWGMTGDAVSPGLGFEGRCGPKGCRQFREQVGRRRRGVLLRGGACLGGGVVWLLPRRPACTPVCSSSSNAFAAVLESQEHEPFRLVGGGVGGQAVVGMDATSQQPLLAVVTANKMVRVMNYATK